MKIHIISSPNDQNLNLNEIKNILNSVDGELKFEFIGSSFINEYLFKTLCPSLYNATNESKFEFIEFFEYCQEYRNISSETIPKNEVVVFITSIKNSKGWFSAVSGKNVFIYTGYWDNLVGQQKNFAIAYNILVNIFQSLLGISHNHFDYFGDIIHMENIGCINDFCNLRSNILIKLRTGYICNTCIEFASTIISNDITVHIFLLINKIKENFSNYDLIKSLFEPVQISISEDAIIMFGDKQLKLTVFQKSLYILFLKYPNGLKFSDINKKIKEFNKIYHVVRIHTLKSYESRRDIATLTDTTEYYTNISNNNFQYHKSCLNSELTLHIGVGKSDDYLISKDSTVKIKNESTFKINLNSKYIKNNFNY